MSTNTNTKTISNDQGSNLLHEYVGLLGSNDLLDEQKIRNYHRMGVITTTIVKDGSFGYLDETKGIVYVTSQRGFIRLLESAEDVTTSLSYVQRGCKVSDGFKTADKAVEAYRRQDLPLYAWIEALGRKAPKADEPKVVDVAKVTSKVETLLLTLTKRQRAAVLAAVAEELGIEL